MCSDYVVESMPDLALFLSCCSAVDVVSQTNFRSPEANEEKEI